MLSRALARPPRFIITTLARPRQLDHQELRPRDHEQRFALLVVAERGVGPQQSHEIVVFDASIHARQQIAPDPRFQLLGAQHGDVLRDRRAEAGVEPPVVAVQLDRCRGHGVVVDEALQLRPVDLRVLRGGDAALPFQFWIVADGVVHLCSPLHSERAMWSNRLQSAAAMAQGSAAVTALHKSMSQRARVVQNIGAILA